MSYLRLRLSLGHGGLFVLPVRLSCGPMTRGQRGRGHVLGARRVARRGQQRKGGHGATVDTHLVHQVAREGPQTAERLAKQFLGPLADQK